MTALSLLPLIALALQAGQSPAGQSPIDINPKQVVNGDLAPLHFHYAESASITLSNTGSPEREATVKAKVPAGSSIEIADHVYQLMQFHFHAASEHSINGKRAPLELHLVHQDAAGNLAVVGILIHSGAFNRTLDGLFSQLPQHAEQPQTVQNVNLQALIPQDHSCYRYQGSLTTAPYTEGVKWHVFKAQLGMSPTNIHAFRQLFPQGDSREAQPIAGRRVYTSVMRTARK